jgi:hypothetical protein
VAERREEAEVLAEARLRVGVDTRVEVGSADREPLEDEGEHQHSGTGDGPGDQRARRARLLGEPPRQGEDAGPDHRSDDHRRERQHREFGGEGRLGVGLDLRHGRPTAVAENMA